MAPSWAAGARQGSEAHPPVRPGEFFEFPELDEPLLEDLELQDDALEEAVGAHRDQASAASFQELDKSLLARITSHDEAHAKTLSAHRDQARVISFLETLKAPQRFYKKHKVLRIDVDLATRPIQLWYADNGVTVLSLNTGKEGPIYQINKMESLSLTSQQVGEYLKFFIRHTRGEGGARRVVESAKDVPWLPEEFMNDELWHIRGCAEGRIKKLRIQPFEEKKAYRVEATLQCGVQLFDAAFVVQSNGQVSTVYEKQFLEHLKYLPISSVI